MTSRERFEAWAIANMHAFKTDEGELFFVEGVGTGAALWEAWQEAERQALEIAAQTAWKKTMSNHEPGKEINRRVLGGYIADSIRALVEPK